MSVQLVAVVLIVAGAVAYLLRATWKTWAGKSAGCGSGCGGCARPPEELATVKARLRLPQV